MNHLYFGDCLDVLKELKEQHPQPFIDLIYIDPPFNSKRNYNVLFESMDMKALKLINSIPKGTAPKGVTTTETHEQTSDDEPSKEDLELAYKAMGIE